MPAESWYVFIKLVENLLKFFFYLQLLLKTKSEFVVSVSLNVFKMTKGLNTNLEYIQPLPG
jgi:hypothetical protein